MPYHLSPARGMLTGARLLSSNSCRCCPSRCRASPIMCASSPISHHQHAQACCQAMQCNARLVPEPAVTMQVLQAHAAVRRVLGHGAVHAYRLLPRPGRHLAGPRQACAGRHAPGPAGRPGAGSIWGTAQRSTGQCSGGRAERLRSCA